MQVHQRSELKLCMNGEHSSFFNFFFLILETILVISSIVNLISKSRKIAV